MRIFLLSLVVAVGLFPGCGSEGKATTSSPLPTNNPTPPPNNPPTPKPLVIVTTALPDGKVGTAYNQTLQASGGTTPYTWSLKNGNLPSGLALDGVTGSIRGTPLVAGSSSFDLKVGDSANPPQEQVANLNLFVASAATTPLTIITTSLPVGTRGQPYQQTLRATGGTMPYQWSVISGSLSPGLSLDATTGAISGTITTNMGISGYAFRVRVVDSSVPVDFVNSGPLVIGAQAAPVPLAIATVSLPPGQPNVAYQEFLGVTGGTPPYSWALTGGSLPSGLDLKSAGEISGTPTVAGTATFTVTVTDSATPAVSTSKLLSITISVPTPVWTNLGPEGGTVYALATHPTNRDIAYAGCWTGEVLKTTDGGRDWLPSFQGLPHYSGNPIFEVRALVLDPTNPDILYVGLRGDSVWKSTDGGASWLPSNTGLSVNNVTVSNITALAVASSNTQVVYAATEFKGVFRSNNYGANWTAVNNGLDPSNRAPRSLVVDPSHHQTVYAGTWQNGVFKTTDGGANWTNVGSNATGLVDTRIFALAIHPTTTDVLYAGSLYGGVFRSDNGGTSWTAVNQGLGSLWIEALLVDPAQPATVYAATRQGVYRSLNSGSNWSLISNSQSWFWYRVLAVGSRTSAANQTLYAGATGGGVHTLETGGTWTARNHGINNLAVREVVLDPANHQTVYVASDGGIYRSLDGGASWETRNGGLLDPNALALLINPSNSQVVYAGTEAGVYQSSNGGATWNLTSNGLPSWGGVLELVFEPGSTQTIYAGSNNGLYKSIDGGTNWAASYSGITSSIGWQIAVTAIVIHPINKQVLYAAVVEGGVFQSTNGGGSWQAMNNGITDLVLDDLALDPSDPQVIYATGRGGVFKTTTGGGSWVASNLGLGNREVSSLAFYPTNSLTLYAQTAEGIFKSTAGGQNWSALSANVTSPGGAVIILDSLNPLVMYVGVGDNGVFKTTTGGQ